MKTSTVGQRVIKAFESCLKPIGGDRFVTYRCPANVVTIGWGTTAADVPDLKEGDIWTRAKCDEVFADSLAKYEAGVAKAIGARQLNQNQFDALVSFAYNCGVGALNGSVGAAVREGRDADVPACLMKWVKADGKTLNGLVRRRKAEGLLYAGKVGDALQVAGAAMNEPMPQKVDEKQPLPPEVKTAGKIAVGSGGLLAVLMAILGPHWPLLIGAAVVAGVIGIGGYFLWRKVSK